MCALIKGATPKLNHTPYDVTTCGLNSGEFPRPGCRVLPRNYPQWGLGNFPEFRLQGVTSQGVWFSLVMTPLVRARIAPYHHQESPT